ncbi:MAG: CoA ester lyase, partial [Frankia sp.]|nr:CoA ester lyase [Frankia sp.]
MTTTPGHRVTRWRSLLFTPANRPDLIAKQARFGADVVVVDLEDGTPAGAKAQGRTAAVEAVPKLRAEHSGAVLLRVNAVSDAVNFAADLDCYAALDIDGIVIPKIETREDVERLEAELRARGVADRAVVYGLETVAGVHRAAELMTGATLLHAAYFGAEDYIADLGGRR